MRYELELPGLDLSVAEAADEAFMEELFRSTHDHLYAMDVPAQYINALVKQQYQLQKNAYQNQWPDATSFIIRSCEHAIGKIVIHEEQSLLHFIDCAFVPEERGKGYGTAILRSAQAVAEKHQIALKLSVERHNLRAKKLYLSIGFDVVEETASHEIMTWSPPMATTTHN